MTQRLLCIDYGKKFIGLAVANFPSITARALETLQMHKGEGDVFSQIKNVLEREQVTKIVLGFPYSDVEGEIHAAIREFNERLTKYLGEEIPIELVDESYSSAEADELILETGIGRKKKFRNQDSEAAKIILLRYLQS